MTSSSQLDLTMASSSPLPFGENMELSSVKIFLPAQAVDNDGIPMHSGARLNCSNQCINFVARFRETRSEEEDK